MRVAKCNPGYFQDAFKKDLPHVTSWGRDRNIVSGEGEPTDENAVVFLSQCFTIGPNGKSRKMICQRGSVLASRQAFRGYTCGKRGKPCVAVRCGCHGLCGRVATQGSPALTTESSDPTCSSKLEFLYFTTHEEGADAEARIDRQDGEDSQHRGEEGTMGVELAFPCVLRSDILRT